MSSSMFPPEPLRLLAAEIFGLLKSRGETVCCVEAVATPRFLISFLIFYQSLHVFSTTPL